MTKSKNINSTPQSKTEANPKVVPNGSSAETPVKHDDSSKVRRTSHGFRIEGRSDLIRRGIDVSDTYIVHLGQPRRTKKPSR